MRIIHESEKHEISAFITLTYDNEHLPHHGDLVRAHFVLFMKRLRYAVSLKKNGGRKLKYFGCGEYGELRGRPHYHAIILGIGPDDFKLLEECWGLGKVHLGTLSDLSANYVTGYVMKKYGAGMEAERHSVKPFQLQSQGIGKAWLLKHADKVVEEYAVRHHGEARTMPRYYKRYLDDLSSWSDDDINMRKLARSAERQAFLERVGVGVLEEWKYNKAERAQKAEENKFRASVKRNTGF